MNCRHCKKKLDHVFIDLGSSPPSNSYLSEKTLIEAEKWYPLKVLVCDNCWLVQTEDFVGVNEMFSQDYAYFSSFSSSWLNHAKEYVTDMIERFNLNDKSNIVEVAANDGYLLQFVQDQNIPCYGIEPTHGTAMAARDKGIEIIEEFFGERLAHKLIKQGKGADLTAANNVLAHVPDINDFVKGFSIILNKEGVATFEFPHILNLVMFNQFDTIYHEHYSYLSLISVIEVFQSNGLSVFDVDEIPTHGGSLRVFAQRSDTGFRHISEKVVELKSREIKAGLASLKFYEDFQKSAEEIKLNFIDFLIKAKVNKKKVVAYGAAAKGNTLMNFAGIRSDLIQYVVDKNPAKQGKFMPGSRIPIENEKLLIADSPDYVVIFPWNLKKEVTSQLKYIKNNGGDFVTFIPSLEIF
jgi:hypothetical protein